MFAIINNAEIILLGFSDVSSKFEADPVIK